MGTVCRMNLPIYFLVKLFVSFDPSVPLFLAVLFLSPFAPPGRARLIAISDEIQRRGPACDAGGSFV